MRCLPNIMILVRVAWQMHHWLHLVLHKWNMILIGLVNIYLGKDCTRNSYKTSINLNRYLIEQIVVQQIVVQNINISFYVLLAWDVLTITYATIASRSTFSFTCIIVNSEWFSTHPAYDAPSWSHFFLKPQKHI